MRIISSQDLFESYMSDLDEAAVRVPRKVRGAKPSDAEWQRGRSDAGKIISGDDKTGPKGYQVRGFGDAPVAPGQRPPSPQFGLHRDDRNSFRHHYEWSKKGYGRVGGAKGLPKPQAEEFELWVKSLVNEGYDLSEYTWDDVYEIYETYSDYLTLQAFLIGEGYADSLQESDYMIENMDEDLIEEILEEGYKKLPVGKMMRQAARKPVKAAARMEKSGPSSLGVMVAGEPNWMIRRALKQAAKMARVAERHSTSAKGKGRIRGEGQAMLNKIRGENR